MSMSLPVSVSESACVSMSISLSLPMCVLCADSDSDRSDPPLLQRDIAQKDAGKEVEEEEAAKGTEDEDVEEEEQEDTQTHTQDNDKEWTFKGKGCMAGEGQGMGKRSGGDLHFTARTRKLQRVEQHLKTYVKSSLLPVSVCVHICNVFVYVCIDVYTCTYVHMFTFKSVCAYA